MEKRNKTLKEGFGRLNPYTDRNRLIKIRGMLPKLNLNSCVVHQLLLPKKRKIIGIRMTWCHYKVAHIGRNVIFNEIRSSG